jgi:hypothetical protein
VNSYVGTIRQNKNTIRAQKINLPSNVHLISSFAELKQNTRGQMGLLMCSGIEDVLKAEISKVMVQLAETVSHQKK